MPDLDTFLTAFCSKINDAIVKGKRIIVVTHTDADGIVSGSIVGKAMLRMGGRCIVRCVSDLTPVLLKELASQDYEFYIFTDLGAGLTHAISEYIPDGDKEWVVIDHHQLPDDEYDDDRVCNAWKFGIDGGKEASAGTMAYKVATVLDSTNKDLSTLAVVSMLADRQDQGERKSLLGLNSEVADEARELGLLDIDIDLMLVNRETRAVHEALAYTSYPYIDGLTWNVDACYSLLTAAGIRLKDDGRWRVPAELSNDEKSAIIDAIARFLSISSNSKADTILDELVGYVYTLVREDGRSMLRDAREFGNLLNATARIGKSGVGIGICLGDRGSMLREGEVIVNEYRKTLRHYITSIMNNERWRVNDDGKLVIINGDALIMQDMLGAVSSLLSGSQVFQGRILIVKTRTSDGTYKFSARKCINCSTDINLGLLMRECSSACNGTGGGHDAAAGARVNSDMLDEFIKCIKDRINRESYGT
jgi:single-stranded-DNA-specific exonuclease